LLLMASPLDHLLADIRACTVCADQLPLGPRPVAQASETARILIVGQAPGTKVHATGLPFNDPSGDRLRDWMGIDRATFYDASKIAILPAGLCYPGRGKSGDLPPMPGCAERWHPRLRPLLPNLRLTVLIGAYAQAYYLGDTRHKTLAETVAHFADYDPAFLPTPHPSPRNRLWLRKHPWFEQDVVPILKRRVAALLSGGEDA